MYWTDLSFMDLRTIGVLSDCYCIVTVSQCLVHVFLLPPRAHLDKLLAYCEEGMKEGATLVYGGKRVNHKGWCRTVNCNCWW